MKKLSLSISLLFFINILFAQNTIKYNNSNSIVPQNVSGKQINTTIINNLPINSVMNLNNSIADFSDFNSI